MASSNPNYRGSNVENSSPPSSPSQSSSDEARNRSPTNQWNQQPHDSPTPSRSDTIQPVEFSSTEWRTKIVEMVESVRYLTGTTDSSEDNALITRALNFLILDERDVNSNPVSREREWGIQLLRD